MNRKQMRKAMMKKSMVAATLTFCLVQQAVAAEAAHSETVTAQSGPSFAEVSVMSGTATNSGEGSASVSSGTAIRQAEAIDIAGGLNPADANISKDEAVSILRRLFPHLQDAEVDRAEFGDPHSNPPSNEKVWTIQWSYRSGNSGIGFNSSVDAMTGEVLQANIGNLLELKYGNIYEPPQMTREQALEKVKAFIAKASPTIKQDQLSEANVQYPDEQSLFAPAKYYFRFNIQVDGVSSDNESLSVTTDGNGEVTDYYRSRSELPYPSAKPAITQQQADRILADRLVMELAYVPVYRDGALQSYMLAYRPAANGYQMIDAQTGKPVAAPAGEQWEHAETIYKRVPRTDATFIPKTGGVATGDEAVKLVTDAANVPDGMQLRHSSLTSSRGVKNEQMWLLTWANEENRAMPFGGDRFTAQVDADTGRVIRFGTERFPMPGVRSEGESKQPAGQTVTQQQAERTAIELVNKLYPNAAEALKLASSPPAYMKNGDSDDYLFYFQRFYNDVPVDGDTVTVGISRSGAVRSYSAERTGMLEHWAEGQKAAVTAEQALQTYREQAVMELRYARFGGYYGTDGKELKPSVKLVYDMKFKDRDRSFIAYIDANNGKLTQTWSIPGGGAKDAEQAAKDIEGHPSEKALTKLLLHGILTPDEQGRLQPDRSITYGEWLAIMSKAVNPYYQSLYPGMNEAPFADVAPESPYFAAVKYAIQEGWLAEDRNAQLRPEQGVTREMLAVSLAKIVKYDKLSQFLADDKTVAELKDASSIERKGAAALSLKLGLLQPKDGKFEPQGTVTRADAAEIVMRLVALQGKIDTAIGR
ncbi:hypothetical protein PAE9249_01830 [Paenibacillus sp. CECT 9249]|uniref:YcdB/YcdC domain-containing protein n=1 Tax=Paenibacillus sp. CECT 9249 TaxID=2845385 RepID=UPI001E5B35A8|nr:YcdB/YcdC domain-containing protein [Paenibacillus sp. CECT 9249]CAH0119331.1 hypothetical protein PAE9249_01830 [Paenibacillus sp. CECT 9249]